MIIDRKEFIQRIIESLQNDWADERTTDDGEIVILTSMYEWENGTIHDEPECFELSADDLIDDKDS